MKISVNGIPKANFSIIKERNENMKRISIYLKAILAIAVISVLVFGICVVSSATDASSDLRIAYCNLSFENDTHLMYAIRSDAANVRLLVWSDHKNDYLKGTESAELLPLESQMEINGEPYTVFKYTGLAAKQMTDNVYVRACIDNGNGDITYGGVHKYSILQYAYNKLGKTGQATTNEKLIKMLEDMLAYGASAQNYHNYKTDRLATDAFVQLRLTAGNLPDGFSHGLYRVGESVNIVAPLKNAEDVAFTQWIDKNGNVIASTAEHALTVGNENNAYTPEYISYSSGLEFDTNGDGTCYLVDIGTCTDLDVKIPPSSPDGDVVIGIEGSTFADTDIISVSIPSTVVEIGRKAFNNCTALTDVYYGGSESDWALVEIATGNTALESATLHFAKVETYTVTFVDHNGAVIKTETVNKGASATAPAAPTREGYTFSGWDKAFENVTGDVTVTATYSFVLTEPTIYSEKISVIAGQTEVAIPIMFYNIPDIAAMSLTLEYDESIFTLKEVTNGTALSSSNYSYIPSASLESGGNWNWLDTTLTGVAEDGVLFTLVFDVANDASANDYSISLSYAQGSILDKNEEPLNVNIINAAVAVLPQ